MGLALAWALAGCGHLLPADGPAAHQAAVDDLPSLVPPWAEALFAPPGPAVPRPEQVLAIDAAMRHYLDDRLAATPQRQLPPPQRLIEALYTPGELRLEYDARSTRSAPQAFADRRGNCLSLVLMTAVFAREMGLEVQFNEALVHQPWQQEGDLVLRTGHVNLTLRTAARTDARGYTPGYDLMVDFLPGQDLQRLRTRPITQARVLAMYFNNLAAESLAEGRVGDAFWLARASLAQDRGYDEGRNTLGVVYLRAGAPELAGRAFEAVLSRQPEQVSALNNLALVRVAQGRASEAASLRLRRAAAEGLVAWQDSPPPPAQPSAAPAAPASAAQALAQARQALAQGDLVLARQRFEQLAQTSGPSAEQQLGLAQVLHRQGLWAQAEAALKQALALGLAADRPRHAGKLAWLQAQRGAAGPAAVSPGVSPMADPAARPPATRLQ